MLKLPAVVAALRSRSHDFWRWYELLTATVGWAGLASFLVVFWNQTTTVTGLPQLLPDWSAWLWGIMATAVAWIWKADRLKYKFTKDPRDEPFRKWGSFKHAQRFMPGERVFLREQGVNLVHGCGAAIAQCPTCSHVHGFAPNDIGAEHKCGIYGCEGTIDLRQPRNYRVL
jgi:hypothetical protein